MTGEAFFCFLQEDHLPNSSQSFFLFILRSLIALDGAGINAPYNLVPMISISTIAVQRANRKKKKRIEKIGALNFLMNRLLIKIRRQNIKKSI